MATRPSPPDEACLACQERDHVSGPCVIIVEDEETVMNIAILTLTFALPGCRSLKEKRQRMGGLHERFGRNPAIAVCESGDHDRHDASEWTFVVVGATSREVASLCSEIEDRLQRTVDGRVMEATREWL